MSKTRKPVSSKEISSPCMTFARRWGRRSITFFVGLWLPFTTAAASFQMVVELDCGLGTFVVDARPFAANEAGSSRVDVRYRYRGESLTALRFEDYYRNLDSYLHADKPLTVDFGMQLDRSRDAVLKRGKYEAGDTLYLSQAKFSRAEFDALANCLRLHNKTLRSRFAEVVVRGRSMFGLASTEASLGVQGIARLVHAEAPLMGVYGEGGYLVLVERSGRVVLHTNYTPNNASSSAVVGLVRTEGNKPVIRATKTVNFEGKPQDVPALLRHGMRNRLGRDLSQDYNIEFD